jgi:hypothetical protein
MFIQIDFIYIFVLHFIINYEDNFIQFFADEYKIEAQRVLSFECKGKRLE